MNSYQVRFWDIKKISDTARGRQRVRWAVDGREHCSHPRPRHSRMRSWARSKTPPATASRSTLWGSKLGTGVDLAFTRLARIR